MDYEETLTGMEKLVTEIWFFGSRGAGILPLRGHYKVGFYARHPRLGDLFHYCLCVDAGFDPDTRRPVFRIVSFDDPAEEVAEA